MLARVAELVAVLFEVFSVEVVGDRELARAVFRQARLSEDRGWVVRGSEARDEDGTPLFLITVDPPLCDGGCGDRTPSVTGMCYQCQCEAHADGWYDMDEGYARI